MKKAFTKIASVLFLAVMALWTSDALAGCNDPLACNFVSTDTDTIDCVYPGCQDSTACNYDSTAGCPDVCLFNDACGDCGGAGTVAGCVDSTACNFNSLADCDDSSCLFDDACGNCGGSGTVAGCMDTTACNYDSLADCDDGSCLIGASGCTDSTNCNYDSLAVCDDGSCGLEGCTDTTACNYALSAVCDDGSCLYLDSCGDCGGSCLDNCLVIDMTDSFGDGWNGGGYSIADASTGVVVASGDIDTATTGDGSSVGSDNLCLADGCYTIFVGGGTFESEIGWSLTGADATLAGGAPFSGTFSINTANCFGCMDTGACNYDSLAQNDDGSCDYSCIGCGDSIACNYGGSGITTDDGSCCYQECVNINVAGGFFESEISWALVSLGGTVVASGGAPYNEDLCIPADCYNFEMTDSFGDGWNGATYTVASQNGIVIYGTGGLISGSAGTDSIGGIGAACGCTDSAACNFDCDADVDNGTCCLDNCLTVTVGGGTFDSEITWSLDLLDGTPVAAGGAGSVDICAPTECYTFTLMDSFGDGWNGAIYTVGATDGSAVYATGTLDDGSLQIDEFGVPLACGCTDPTACNYDSTAVADNGTCGYYDIQLIVGGDAFDSEISWTLNLDSDGTLVASGGAPTDILLCLNQDCYIFNMFDSFGDGWGTGSYSFIDLSTGLTILTGTLATGSSASVGIAIDGGAGCIVVGCTDDGNQGTSPFPGFAACNYNATANVDDGTCEYTSCDGCQDDGTLATSPFPGIAACDYDAAATIPAACDYSCIGCTDTTACNYDSVATVDDGSCCTDNCVTLDMADSFGDGWNGATWTITDDLTAAVVATGDLDTAIDGDGASAASESLCLPDGCYSISVGGGSFDSEISWTLSGVQGGSISGGAPADESFGVGAAVCALGCTNSLACNYDSTAITDDGSCCTDGCFELFVGGGTFESEISWELYSSGQVVGVDVPLYSGFAPETVALCLAADCAYQFHMIDSFGDGWNGGAYTITDLASGEVAATNSLGSGLSNQVDVIALGVSYGCTDSLANNYDPSADCDDGTCITCAAGETAVAIVMNDAFGDGWNGATYTITDDEVAGAGTVLATGGIVDAVLTQTDWVCLPDPGCFSMEVGGGSWDSEITWEVYDQSGSLILSGVAPSGVLGWGINAAAAGCNISGCTDSSCFNFNPFAGVDDGSCICPPVNNDCGDAIGVICGSQVFGTTIDSTDNEGLIGTDCDGSGDVVTSSGVWYVFDGTGDQVTVATCGAGTGYDTKLHVYEALPDCDNLVCVASGDDGCNILDPPFSSTLSFNSSVATDYYILVSGFGIATGDFQLDISCINCTPIPINDDCSGAVDLGALAGAPVSGTTCCAGPDGENGCLGFDPGYGIWYYMNSSDFDTFNFELNNGTGASVGMAVLIDNGGGCGDMTTLACCPEVTGTCAGDISAITTLVPNTDYYFIVYTTDAANCGDFNLSAAGEYLGCTDDAAINYDSQATIDDGSCEYDCTTPPPANDDCSNAVSIDCVPAGSVSVDGTTGCATLADYPLFGGGCNGNPGGGVWYTFVGTGDLHTIYTCGSPTDTQIDIFTGTCGFFTCAQDVAPSPNAGVFLTEIDDADVAGQCGFFNQDDTYLQFISDAASVYFVHVTTSAPLQGGAFTINHDCETVVPGCMEAAACNYNSLANVDDGSCDFTSCVCADAGCAGTGVVYVLEMQDSFGDGWNGAVWTITDGQNNVVLTGDLDNADVVSDTDNFEGPEFGTDYFCICTDECYTITVGGGSWDSEITWQLFAEDGVTPIAATGGGNVEGVAPDSSSWTQGLAVCGCMDPGACNFNPLATVEDGSCEYLTCAGCTDSVACNYDSTATIDDLSCCYDNCITVDMTDAFGDGWNGADYTITEWSTGTVVATGDIDNAQDLVLGGIGGGPAAGTDFLCIADGCYFINVGGGTFDSEVGWQVNGTNAGSISGGAPSGDVYFSLGAGSCTTCQEALACNYDANAPVADCNLCDYDCTGCTYSFSPNYDSLALIDDGSCTCPPDPCPEDLAGGPSGDGDGVVNTADLLAFLTAFGTFCP